MASFHENLDELLEILKRIKAKSIGKKLGDIDVSFLDDFELIIENYELIKSTISPDMLDSIGEPMRGLIEGLVETLKSELSEVVTQAQKNGAWRNADEDLERLNNLLKRPDISNKEIDELLDKRSELLKALSEKKEA